jgi:hypothetical protein
MIIKFNFAASIPREEDHQTISLCFTGGLKAWNVSDDIWSISPVLYHGDASIVGKLRTADLRSLMQTLNYEPVIYERRTSIDGDVALTFRPFHPMAPSSQLTGADLWQTAGNNIMRARMAEFVSANPDASYQERNKAADAATSEERYITAVSDSLRSMDICLGAICNFYHDQTISGMRSGKKPTERFSNLLDLPFNANVHSFFLHLGAAFGYLGALLAARCNLAESVDDLTRFVGNLRANKLPSDPMLDIMISESLIASSEGTTKFKLHGWLASSIKVRNEFVHKRPYGSKRAEEWGWLLACGEGDLFAKYFRPMLIDGDEEKDALEVISGMYLSAMRLFERLVSASGYSAALPHFTDKDFLSFKVLEGKQK